ncbi:hypothetical protein HanPI659440_Chr04g0144511 [Helianthus annuus]|nr:hypothetical protein HanPI659440_Chr04g0144511 [Helianthus annuus]
MVLIIFMLQDQEQEILLYSVCNLQQLFEKTVLMNFSTLKMIRMIMIGSYIGILWLLTPPGTPLFPSLEMGSHKTVMNQNGTHKAHPSAAKSRVRAIPFTFENTQPLLGLQIDPLSMDHNDNIYG